MGELTESLSGLQTFEKCLWFLQEEKEDLHFTALIGSVSSSSMSLFHNY